MRSSTTELDPEVESLILGIMLAGAAYYFGYRKGRSTGYNDVVRGLERAQRIIHLFNTTQQEQ